MSHLIRHPAIWPLLAPGLDAEPHHTAADPESIERCFSELYGRESARYQDCEGLN